VRGPALVRVDTGTPVRLRGVNRSGLEYADPGPAGAGPAAFLDSVGFDEADLGRIACWGANIVRVPFTQAFVLRGRGGASGADYLAAVDRVVAWAEASGLYTLLDLQWIDAETPRGIGQDGSINRVPALPDADSIDLWRILAARYRDRPSVLFDLFNEPHTPMADDDAPLVGVRPDGGLWRLPSRVVGMDEWQPWALRLIAEIRAVHPQAVIFVSGVRWAYDLRGFPLRRRSGHAVEGLVYSTHVYPWTTIGLLPGRTPEREWHRAFGHLAAACPVFAAEWGGDGSQVDWGRRLLAYLEATTVGWTAWSWCDWPMLLTSHRGGDWTPTPFGDVVKAGLGRSGGRSATDA
jgi:endoglucanase